LKGLVTDGEDLIDGHYVGFDVNSDRERESHPQSRAIGSERATDHLYECCTGCSAFSLPFGGGPRTEPATGNAIFPRSH
jgi:hypothetical protein